MINQIEREFLATLKREKKCIKYNDKIISVFFRKNNDNNNDTNYLTMYYNDKTIKQGSLINYNGKYFIVLNCETEENNIYKKSALLECNSNFIVNDKILPIYANTINSPLPNSSGIVTFVGGWIEIQMEDTPLSRQIKLNDIYNIVGGSYKVINLVIMNGKVIVYLERDAVTESKFALSINDIPKIYNVGDKVLLTANVYKDDNIDTTQYNITWQSIDNNSTISSDGIVNILQGTKTTITATVNINGKLYYDSIVLEINPIFEPTVPLVSIAVTTPPTKVKYIVGETLDTTGMVVTGTYSDNSTKVITDYTYSPTEPLKLTDTAVTIEYKGKHTTIPITVSESIVVGNTATITGRDTLPIGYSRNYTATFKDINGLDIALEPIWDIEYTSNILQGNLTITYPEPNKISIAVPNNSDYIDCSFKILLKDKNNTCNTFFNVSIIYR